MYGRLRRIAALAEGRCAQFVSVGGVPAYRGWMNPFVDDAGAVAIPTAEDAPTTGLDDGDEKGYRIVRTEEAVFAHHPTAAHFRYPYVYGPYQLAPREWLVVRRVLDGRERIIVPDEGLTLHHHGYTENLAHALLLAIDRPDAAAGKLFNCGDEEVLSIRQVVALIAHALGHDLEIISMPYDLAMPARPLMTQPLPTHRVLDLTRLRHDLGYHDVVPARRALEHTARWLAEHPCEPGGMEEMVLTDPFDYAAEDALIASSCARRAPRSNRRRSRSSPATALRTAVPAAGRARVRSSKSDCAAAGGHQGRRPVDRAHRAVRGRAARRPGCRGDQGRAAGFRRHRPLRRCVGQRHERAVSSVQPRQAQRGGRRAHAGRSRHRARPRGARRCVRAELPARCRRAARHRPRRPARRQRPAGLRVALGLRAGRSLRAQGCVRHGDPGVRRVRREPGRRRDRRRLTSSTRPRPTR